MAKICLCLTAKTLARNLEVLEDNRKYIDIAELRVDCLDPDERFLIRRFPEMAGLPVILTIRRGIEGGHFVGGEGSRIALLAKGLAYAVMDKRRNFAYVDLEEDLDVPGLEEAARAFGTRIIRSWHNMDGVGDDLALRLRRLRRVGDELVKVAVTPRSVDDVIKLYRTAKETADVDKILLGMGGYSTNTRVLADFLGSKITYAFPGGESDLVQTGLGQFDPKELVELYRLRSITPKTKVFAVTGYPLKVTDSPHFFNTAFKMEQIDAVYVPIPSDSIVSLLSLAQEIGISGISVTFPHKEKVLPFLAFKSEQVEEIGACNTVVASPNGWRGYNTDATAFSDSLLSFTGWKDFRRRKVTIIGAGGAAKAVAFQVFRLRGKALVLNRTVARARNLAQLYHFDWAGFDSRGTDLIEKYSDLIIQTSSVGMESGQDPLEFYKFSGRETVMDLIYKPERTSFLKRAEEAGCRVLSGKDMFHRQARIQYGYYMNKEFPASLISRAGL